jgi:hypothetical protein
MKSNPLFPHCMKPVGWALFIPGVLLGILMLLNKMEAPSLFEVNVFAIADLFPFGAKVLFGITKNNILDEIISMMVIVGALLVAFSKEKHEDELIARIRMESLIWATYVNYMVLAFCIIFLYSFGFVYALIINMFTILVFFLIRYYWALYRFNKFNKNEE